MSVAEEILKSRGHPLKPAGGLLCGGVMATCVCRAKGGREEGWRGNFGVEEGLEMGLMFVCLFVC